MLNEDPLTFPLAYFFMPLENGLGGGKSTDVGKVCGPDVGGGDGTLDDNIRVPFTAPFAFT